MDKAILPQVDLVAWDVRERDRIWPLYRHFLQNLDGFIWVIDGNDRDLLDLSIEHLVKFYVRFPDCLLGGKDAPPPPLLIYLTKKDLVSGMNMAEFVEKSALVERMTELEELGLERWHLQPCEARMAGREEVMAGLRWLMDGLDGAVLAADD